MNVKKLFFLSIACSAFSFLGYGYNYNHNLDVRADTVAQVSLESSNDNFRQAIKSNTNNIKNFLNEHKKQLETSGDYDTFVKAYENALKIYNDKNATKEELAHADLEANTYSQYADNWGKSDESSSKDNSEISNENTDSSTSNNKKDVENEDKPNTHVSYNTEDKKTKDTKTKTNPDKVNDGLNTSKSVDSNAKDASSKNRQYAEPTKRATTDKKDSNKSKGWLPQTDEGRFIGRLLTVIGVAGLA